MEWNSVLCFLLNFHNVISFQYLYKEFVDFGLEARLIWLLKNLEKALGLLIENTCSKEKLKSYKKSFKTIRAYAEIFEVQDLRDGKKYIEDVLIPKNLKFRNEKRFEFKDEISEKFKIVTDIAFNDFYKVLAEVSELRG